MSVEELISLRQRLVVAFSPDTSVFNEESLIASTGHCAAVALIVFSKLGGCLVSSLIENKSHWYNRIQIGGVWCDVDLTGDQFGLPAIQVARAHELYAGTRVRALIEVNEKTHQQSELLRRRAMID